MSKILNDKYKLLSQFQAGAQAETWLAENIETGRKVVIKKISLSSAKNWKAVELFEREQKVIQNLQHPSVPIYIDGFHKEEGDDISLYIVQQYISGKSLQELLKSGKRFTNDQIFKVIKELMIVLQYLHSLNPAVIHRDIKPSNIIWGDDDKIYLIDFGAIQKLSLNNGGSTIVGTSGYMAPEQIMSQAKPGSDIYSIGATVIELLTHKDPSSIPVKNMKIAFEDYVDQPENFIQFINKMVEPDVDKRYQSADDVLNDLKKVKNNTPLNSPVNKDSYNQAISLLKNPNNYIEHNNRSNHGKKILFFIVGAIGLLTFGGAFFFLAYNQAGPEVEISPRVILEDKITVASSSSYGEIDGVIKDKNLSGCIIDHLNKKNIPLKAENLSQIKSLVCNEKYIKSLNGIENLTNLTNLYIYKNDISDLTPLKSLINLRYLSIWKNNITDLTPLKNLTNLEDLSILFNNISDITPLKNLTKMVNLNISYNKVKNLTPLKNMVLLERLEFGNNKISDITPLENLERVKYLKMERNSIKSLKPISNMKRLESLSINNNEISDLTPIKEMKNLKSLWSSYNKISDITPLKNLEYLENLSLSNNNIRSIDPIKNLKYIKNIYLGFNCIKDINKLKNITFKKHTWNDSQQDKYCK